MNQNLLATAKMPHKITQDCNKYLEIKHKHLLNARPQVPLAEVNKISSKVSQGVNCTLAEINKKLVECALRKKRNKVIECIFSVEEDSDNRQKSCKYFLNAKCNQMIHFHIKIDESLMRNSRHKIIIAVNVAKFEKKVNSATDANSSMNDNANYKNFWDRFKFDVSMNPFEMGKCAKFNNELSFRDCINMENILLVSYFSDMMKNRWNNGNYFLSILLSPKVDKQPKNVISPTKSCLNSPNRNQSQSLDEFDVSVPVYAQFEHLKMSQNQSTYKAVKNNLDERLTLMRNQKNQMNHIDHIKKRSRIRYLGYRMKRLGRVNRYNGFLAKDRYKRRRIRSPFESIKRSSADVVNSACQTSEFTAHVKIPFLDVKLATHEKENVFAGISQTFRPYGNNIHRLRHPFDHKQLLVGSRPGALRTYRKFELLSECDIGTDSEDADQPYDENDPINVKKQFGDDLRHLLKVKFEHMNDSQHDEWLNNRQNIKQLKTEILNVALKST